MLAEERGDAMPHPGDGSGYQAREPVDEQAEHHDEYGGLDGFLVYLMDDLLVVIDIARDEAQVLGVTAVEDIDDIAQQGHYADKHVDQHIGDDRQRERNGLDEYQR